MSLATAALIALSIGCSGKSDPTSSTADVSGGQSGSEASGSGGSGGSGGGNDGSGGGNSGPGGGNSGPGGGNSGPGNGGSPGVDGVAAGIRVRCEVRTGSPRSKISVDGRDLAPGTYRARVTSGGNQQVSGPQATVGDEVEFDFDSNTNEGATPIPASFIQGATVRGEVLTPDLRVVATATATCQVRN
jgi:hypothetical protein